MAAKTLAHGMGPFFKDCTHPESKWPKCPHLYKIQFHDATGRQRVESGFDTDAAAITRLTHVYNAKRVVPGRAGRAARVAKYGAMRFAWQWPADDYDAAGIGIDDDLMVGGVPIVPGLLSDGVIAGGHQSAVHDQHGVLREPLAGLEGEHRPEVIDDPVRRRLGHPA